MRAVVINLDNRPDRMVEFAKNSFPFEVERVSGIVHPDGIEGSTQAHYKTITQQTEFPVAIFEDDCQLLQPWSMIEKAMNQLPPDWDGLWLGGTPTQPLQRYSENLFVVKRTYTNHAIIFNSKIMVDYIKDNFYKSKGRKIMDVFFFEDVQERFKCFITYPMMATQCISRSDCRDIVDQWFITDSYNKFVK